MEQQDMYAWIKNYINTHPKQKIKKIRTAIHKEIQKQVSSKHLYDYQATDLYHYRDNLLNIKVFNDAIDDMIHSYLVETVKFFNKTPQSYRKTTEYTRYLLNKKELDYFFSRCQNLPNLRIGIVDDPFGYEIIFKRAYELFPEQSYARKEYKPWTS